MPRAYFSLPPEMTFTNDVGSTCARSRRQATSLAIASSAAWDGFVDPYVPRSATGPLSAIPSPQAVYC